MTDTANWDPYEGRSNPAAGARFVPLVFAEVRKLLEDEMGFERVQVAKTRELVWQRRVTVKDVPTHYAVRVYSTLEPDGICRNNGADAIRVCLVDLEQGEWILSVEKKVLRTKSALENLRQRARDVYGYVLNKNHRCPKCNRLMVVKKAKKAGTTASYFFGCLGYFRDPKCTHSTSLIPETAK